MKRLLKKIFPFLLLGASLVVVYLSDSNTLDTEDYISASRSDSSSIFDLQDTDVIVLLHIPGTGMTSLSKSLVTDLISMTPCACPPTKTRCSCTNQDGHQWLFQSYNSTGFVCGENADWTTLTESCPIDYWMENVGHDTRKVRRYWMLTLLREPASRFVHEWRHLITRDAYFRNEPRLWRKESPELQKKELPCLVGKKMATLTLREFLDCKDNTALNRMTHILANLTKVKQLGYHGDKYDEALLESAIENLEQLPFFGISENSAGTEDLIASMLGLTFSRRLEILPSRFYKPMSDFQVEPALLRSIRLANNLDVRLYDHAIQIFNVQINNIRGEDQTLGTVLAGRKERFNEDVDDNGDDDDDNHDEDEEKSNILHEQKMQVDESDLDFDEVMVPDIKNDVDSVIEGRVKNFGRSKKEVEADFYDTNGEVDNDGDMRLGEGSQGSKTMKINGKVSEKDLVKKDNVIGAQRRIEGSEDYNKDDDEDDSVYFRVNSENEFAQDNFEFGGKGENVESMNIQKNVDAPPKYSIKTDVSNEKGDKVGNVLDTEDIDEFFDMLQESRNKKIHQSSDQTQFHQENKEEQLQHLQESLQQPTIQAAQPKMKISPNENIKASLSSIRQDSRLISNPLIALANREDKYDIPGAQKVNNLPPKHLLQPNPPSPNGQELPEGFYREQSRAKPMLQQPGYPIKLQENAIQLPIPGNPTTQHPGYPIPDLPGNSIKQTPGNPIHQLPENSVHQLPGNSIPQHPKRPIQLPKNSINQLPGIANQQLPGNARQQLLGNQIQQLPGNQGGDIPLGWTGSSKDVPQPSVRKKRETGSDRSRRQ